MTTIERNETIAIFGLLVAYAIGSWTLAIITVAYFIKACHE